MNNKKKILEVQNLNKIFKTKQGYLTAVDDVSFVLNEGEIVGLVGESGSGKSTIGRMLIRLLPNFSGSVELNNEIISGKKISKEKDRFLRKNIQMIFQNPHLSLNPQKSVFSILEESLKVNKIIKKDISYLFKNWQQVKETFKQTFILESVKHKLEYVKKYYKEIQKVDKMINENLLKQIQVKNYENPLDCFDLINQFYWIPILNLQKYKVNAINTRTIQLINDYRDNKKNFESSEMTENEKKLKDLLSIKKTIIFKGNLSDQVFELKMQLPQLIKKVNIEIKKQKNIKTTTKYLLKSIIQDFHLQANMALQKSYKSESNEKKNYYIKIYKSNKIVRSVISSFKHKIIIAEKQDLLNMKQKTKKVIELMLGDYNGIKNYINKIIYSLVIISKNKLQKSNDLIISIQKDIKSCDKAINFKKQKKSSSKELREVNNKIWITKKINKEKTKQFKKDSKKTIESLRKEITQNYNLILQLENNLNNTLFKKYNAKYKEVSKKVNDYIKNKIQDIKNNNNNKKLSKEDKLYISDKYIVLKEIKLRHKKHLENKKNYILEEQQSLKDLQVAEMLLGIRDGEFVKRRVTKLITRFKIFKALEEVGIEKEHMKHYPDSFSDGQRQRIAIGRALIAEPKIIIADELIASLDFSIQSQIVNLLKELASKKNIGIIFITHDLSMVEYIADKTIILHLGKLVEEGTKDIYKTPIHPYTKNLFKATPKISNSNKHFEINDFNHEYLKDYSDSNQPKFFKIGNGHKVLASEEQLKEWSKGKINKDIIEKSIKQINIKESNILNYELKTINILKAKEESKSLKETANNKAKTTSDKDKSITNKKKHKDSKTNQVKKKLNKKKKEVN